MSPDAYSEPWQASRMELFMKMVNCLVLAIFEKVASWMYDSGLNRPLG